MVAHVSWNCTWNLRMLLDHLLVLAGKWPQGGLEHIPFFDIWASDTQPRQSLASYNWPWRAGYILAISLWATLLPGPWVSVALDLPMASFD